MDGLLPTGEFMGEEFASLNHEYEGLLSSKVITHLSRCQCDIIVLQFS